MLFAKRQYQLDQLLFDAGVVVARQQARAARRGEGNGGDQLWVIIDAVALIGLGPGPVENKLAVGVGFDVAGAGADQLILVVYLENNRLPAPGFETVVLLQRQQKIVLQERVVGGDQRVPCAGVYLADRADNAGLHETGAYSSPSRYFSASSAAMQPVPAEVTAWR